MATVFVLRDVRPLTLRRKMNSRLPPWMFIVAAVVVRITECLYRLLFMSQRVAGIRFGRYRATQCVDTSKVALPALVAAELMSSGNRRERSHTGAGAV